MNAIPYDEARHHARAVVLKYHHVKCIGVHLNDAFNLYLGWFSSLMIVGLALLLYATLKFWYLDLRFYLMYPACALRCGFETFTILSRAGKVNRGSKDLLEHWEKWTRNEKIENANPLFHSCNPITCNAGSFYTLRNSIVLLSFDVVLQLTLNLLLLWV